jgi:hypothetical protein
MSMSLATVRPRTAPAWRAPRRIAPIPLALAAFCLVLSLPARAQSPMIQGWLAANTMCKGGHSDDPKTQKACAHRDELNARLKRRGCQYQEDGDWWRCPH